MCSNPAWVPPSSLGRRNDSKSKFFAETEKKNIPRPIAHTCVHAITIPKTSGIKQIKQDCWLEALAEKKNKVPSTLSLFPCQEMSIAFCP